MRCAGEFHPEVCAARQGIGENQGEQSRVGKGLGIFASELGIRRSQIYRVSV